MKIKIKDTFLGTHNWPDCPHKEVAFLKNEHAHDFIIEIVADVAHDDRDVEFIMLRIWLKKFMDSFFAKNNEIYRFGTFSCEQISNIIRSRLDLEFGDKSWKVAVSEDGVYTGGEW